MERKTVLKVVLVLGLLSAGMAQGADEFSASVISSADTNVRNATSTYGSDSLMYIFGSSTANYMGYVRFDLSSLNIDSIVSASVKMTVSGGAPRNDSVVTGRFALHGLNNLADNTPQNWDEATLNQSKTGLEVSWSTRTLDMTRVTNLDKEDDATMTETIVNGVGGSYARGTTITATGAPLTAFLQSRVDDSGLVTFIINGEITNSRGYGLVTREEATDLAYRPVLEIVYTQTPEPATMMLLGLGGLLLARTKR